jgi:cellulose biosynthesis protein BcsQ
MSHNLTVAVWGNKGAGKTTFCAALAQTLTQYFYSVLLINADVMLPAFAIWGIVPDVKKAEKENRKVESIGSILSEMDLTAEYIRNRISYHPDNNKISLAGYFTNEDCEQYDPISGNAAKSLLNEVNKLFQVTIIDCTMPQTDKLTEKALQYADIVLIMLEPNCIGIGFLNAQSKFFRRNFADGRKYIYLTAKVEPTSEVIEFEYQMGIKFNKQKLPFTQQTRDNLNKLELFQKYDGEYGNTVEIIAERIRMEAENGPG